MALKTVSGFEASDGTFFGEDLAVEAQKYEDYLQFRAWCSDNICRGGEWSSQMVANAILEHWDVTRK